MGAYLSEPVTEKISLDNCNERISVGASSMQGWRVSQEDTHSCLLDFDANTSLFAVFDGHGGAEVAQYCSSHLPECIRETKSYKKGNLVQALEDAFLCVDKTLVTPTVLEELKVLAADGMQRATEADEDEIDHLHTEANMPIDQLIAKYRSIPNVKLRPKEQDLTGPGTSKESSIKDSMVGSSSNSTQCMTDSGDFPPQDVVNGSKETIRDGRVTMSNDETPKKKCVKSEKILMPILQRAARPSSFNDISDESEESDDDDFDQPSSSSDEDEEDESGGDGNDEDDDDSEEDDDDDEDEDEGGPPPEDFFLEGKEEPGYVSGCTAIVALLRNEKLHVANAGDSRCVVCRNGKAIEMSHAHKPENEVEKKRIEAAGGSVTGGRVYGHLNFSRAIGVHSYKKNKTLDAKDQMISALPDIRTLCIDSQDEFMVVACDGIWNSMSSQGIIDFVRERLVPEREKLSTICEELFDKCLSPRTIGDGTGCDNMTCIIVKFKGLSKESAGSLNFFNTYIRPVIVYCVLQTTSIVFSNNNFFSF